jgi:probable DNA metabolism protein
MYSIRMEISYDGSLEGLFSLLEGIFRGDPPPDRVRRDLSPDISPSPPLAGPGEQPDLFGPELPAVLPGRRPETPPRGSPRGKVLAYPGEPCQWEGIAPLPYPAAEELFAVSANAYSDFLYGWMSEFPIEAALLRFAREIMAAARRAGKACFEGLRSPEARRAAERALGDREDAAVRTVLEAARKVQRESDRLMGFLRFRVFPGNIHIARCAPDHFTLPSLARHFVQRFGEIPWAIIDEKRRLTLRALPGEGPAILFGEKLPLPLSAPPAGGAEPWEELWRNYHRSINNGDRNNPQLQRQFMPVRYWKYLPELSPPGK